MAHHREDGLQVEVVVGFRNPEVNIGQTAKQDLVVQEVEELVVDMVLELMAQQTQEVVQVVLVKETALEFIHLEPMEDQEL